MNALKLVILSLATFVLLSCSDDKSQTSKFDIPISVVLNQNDLSRHELLPVDARDILSSVKFEAVDGPTNIIGGSPAGKMNLFDVEAYVEYLDGWLIASGYGEWGGIVFWLSRDGNYKIIRDDDFAIPIDAIADQNTVLLLQAMNYRRLSHGHLLEIIREAGEFKTREYLVTGYPTAFEEVDGQWTVSVGLKDKANYLVDDLRVGDSATDTNQER